MIKIILILLMIIIYPRQVMGSEQNLYLLNNLISYDNWLENVTDLPQYYLKVKRKEKWYQNNIEFSHHDFQDTSRWTTRSAHPYFPSGLPPYFLMDDGNNTNNAYIAHQLEVDEINFINFSFEYKMTNYEVKYNRPVINLDLCGQKNYFILEYKDYTPGLFYNDLNDWRLVTLPNPGTCEENRELKISMWLRFPGDHQTVFKMRNLSFDQAKLREDDEIRIISRGNQELALIEDITIRDQGEQLWSSWSDWQKNHWQIGTVINNEVIASEPLPSYSDGENYLEMAKFKIEQVEQENDGSLSIRFDYQADSNLKAIVLGISEKKEDLYQAWQKVEQIENDFLPNLKNINYISHYDNYQIAHFPLPDWLENGSQNFYFTARAKDQEERWSKMSAVWQCINQACNEITTEKKETVVMSKIFWSPTENETAITLTNQSAININLNKWILSEGMEEGINLEGEIASGEQIIINLPKISRSGGQLKLFDDKGNIADQYNYQALLEPWSWQKNLITHDWKAVYVRN